MKHINILSIIFLLMNTLIQSQPSAEFNRQWAQYNRKEYFKLNSSYIRQGNILSESEKLVISGLIDNLFNRPAESNKKLEEALRNFGGVLNDSIKMEIFQTQMINYVNLFDYENAVKLTTLLLKDYSSMIDSSDTDDMKNSNIIWESAKELSPQSCVRKGDTDIKIKKDMAGYYNIKLKVNGIESEFIFDTGANFSTITSTHAKEMGLKFLKGSLKVGTTTGIKIDARLACAENLEIGNIIYQNVLFLVLPDEALSFAGGLYKIEGIIGFPVIKEMKEVTFTSTRLFVPQVSAKKDLMNMCLRSFIPVINVTQNNDSMIFTFDTGSRKTFLYRKYYEDYKSFIDSNYEAEDLELNGAGGTQTIKGFKLDKIFLVAGGIKSKLTDIELYSEEIKEENKFIYGNMGQDFISGADKMTLNFEYMYIEFINK